MSDEDDMKYLSSEGYDSCRLGDLCVSLVYITYDHVVWPLPMLYKLRKYGAHRPRPSNALIAQHVC